MTDKEKLEKIKALADKMYSRMSYLTSDTRPIRQAMDEYHQFIINEYHKEEPVSEDLGDYINELSKQFPEVSFAKLSRIAVRVAKWQKEQLIASGTDVTVHIEAGNYPYIPQIELYDYEKDIPLAKEGDKYKVILIKED